MDAQVYNKGHAIIWPLHDIKISLTTMKHPRLSYDANIGLVDTVLYLRVVGLDICFPTNETTDEGMILENSSRAIQVLHFI